MKTRYRTALVATGALLSGMMNCTTALAETGGTIHFVGAIVEDPCTVTQRQDSLYTTCRNVDGSQQTARVVLNPDTSGHLPAGKGETQVRWMNTTRTAAVVTLTYY